MLAQDGDAAFRAAALLDRCVDIGANQTYATVSDLGIVAPQP